MIFLMQHGAFASVAGSLVGWLLADARNIVAEAKVYALMHLRTAQGVRMSAAGGCRANGPSAA